MKDKLWFFTSARYFSVNNFIANTFMDDGSQGIDDQFIKNAMARLTWQVSPRNKISAYFDEIDKYRGHDMQSQLRSGDRRAVWNSPAYHTTAIKWTSPVTSSLFLEAGFSNNTEYYTNEYREGIEKPRVHRRVVPHRAQERGRPRRLHAGGPDQHHREPEGALLERRGDVGDGRAHHQVRRQQPLGHVQPHPRCQRRPDPAVLAATPTGVRWSVSRTPSSIRNSPLSTASASTATSASTSRTRWRLNRLTANVGLRWETLNARSRPASRRPAASCRRARSRRSRTCRTGTTSRRAWAWSTTCSATARPRSSIR